MDFKAGTRACKRRAGTELIACKRTCIPATVLCSSPYLDAVDVRQHDSGGELALEGLVDTEAIDVHAVEHRGDLAVHVLGHGVVVVLAPAKVRLPLHGHTHTGVSE